VASVFGKPEEKRNFVVGYTRGAAAPVCIKPGEVGCSALRVIFGATGTASRF
jgi:hypothetical protein